VRCRRPQAAGPPARGGEGRAPVVCAAGTFEGSVEEKAAFARRMHEEGGADVVVVLVCNTLASL
jgi:hypothetical protein